jgi:transposase
MKRRTYTPEFKRSAVALVLEQGRTRQQAADNLGIGVSLIDAWLHQHRKSDGTAHTDEHAGLKKRYAELERENKRLTMERDILKKAAAYFAHDSL